MGLLYIGVCEVEEYPISAYCNEALDGTISVSLLVLDGVDGRASPLPDSGCDLLVQYLTSKRLTFLPFLPSCAPVDDSPCLPVLYLVWFDLVALQPVRRFIPHCIRVDCVFMHDCSCQPVQRLVS